MTCHNRPYTRVSAFIQNPGEKDISKSLFLNFFLMFIYFWERARDRVWAGEGKRERETQNPKQAPGSELAAQSPTPGSNSDCEITTWAEVRLSHPGAPSMHYILKWSYYDVFTKLNLWKNNKIKITWAWNSSLRAWRKKKVEKKCSLEVLLGVH